MLFTTLAAGSYPAFLVSSMTPLDAIRGKVIHLKQKQSLRTALYCAVHTFSRYSHCCAHHLPPDDLP